MAADGSTQRSGRYHVRVVEGPDKGRAIDIAEGTILIGSHHNAELQLTDKSVSRFHVELQPCAGGLRITDLSSTNGTFLAGSQLGTVVITRDVTLRLGTTTILDIAAADATPGAGAYVGDRFGEVIGASQVMRELFGLLDRAAGADSTVLLEGETGTGKELLAAEIHARSKRQAGPFVVVDCATMPKDLSGGEHRLVGEAHGGTLVLDEVGELAPEVQGQLLRVLEKREARGGAAGNSPRVDVRVVATTHRNLSEQVRIGAFREDLYFRLAVVRATVPPLRRHKGDIPLLARHFLRELGREAAAISTDMLAIMMSHDWPGNVRELRSVVERVVSLESGPLQLPVGEDVGATTNEPETRGLSPDVLIGSMLELPFKEAKDQLVEGFEREYLRELMRKHAGNLSRAAAEAGIDRNYVRRLVKKYGLEGK